MAAHQAGSTPEHDGLDLLLETEAALRARQVEAVPIDVLPSLSRLMNAGIGSGKTAGEHREWANELYAT